MSVAKIVLVGRPGQREEQAEALRNLGYEVILHDRSRGDPRVLRQMAPDAMLIDLTSAPASGRELGSWLRRQPATRTIPLVFLFEDAAMAESARSILPDAVFSPWSDVREKLEEALKNPPVDLVVPGAMDAYSGAHLEKKLGIRKGDQVGLLNAPKGFEGLLSRLPEGATLQRDPRSPSKVLLLFVVDRDALEEAFADAVSRLAEGGKLWICWPKKASGVSSDLAQQAVREYGLERGLVDYKICSIDMTWSGLCFSRRG